MGAARTIFDSLEYLLADGSLRYDRRAQPICFEMLDEAGGIWGFDPHRPGRLFARTPVANPVLTIACRAQTLARLFGPEPMAIAPDEPLLIDGDLGALDPLIDNIKDDINLLGLRLRQ